MSANPARATRSAIASFVLGVLSILAVLVAYSLGIRRWPPGLEGPGALLSVAVFPISLVGILLFRWGRVSRARRFLAVVGLALSLAAFLAVLGFWVLVVVDVSNAHWD
jgi:hypothetical protein